MAKKISRLEDLTPDSNNFNKHTEFGNKLLEDSLRKFGAGRSILTDKDGNIIAGNGVTEVAAAIGMEDVEVVHTDGKKLVVVVRDDLELDSPEGRELALADNMTALKGIDLDLDKVTEALGEDIARAWGMELPKVAPEAKEDDFDEKKGIIVRCQPGDIWQLGEHRLMCGDSIKLEEVKKLMGGGMADLWLTDPPYNVAYEGGTKDKLTIKNDSMKDENFRSFLTDACIAAANVMKPGAAFYMWHADSEGYNFRYAVKAANLLLKQTLIWNKNALVLGRQDYQWKHEPCLYGWKDGGSHSWYADRSQTTVLDWDRPTRSSEHPTMKPVGLFAYLMKNSSKEGDVVLDTFGGSGTTLIAAEQLGRKCYMMELDPHYCDVIITRWEELTGQKAKKI